MLGIELLEQREARTGFGLAPQRRVKLLRDLIYLLLNVAQTLLAFFDCAPAVLSLELFGFHCCGKFLEAGGQAGGLFLQLNLFRAEFFEPDGVSLMLQIEGIDFVAGTRNLLRGAERFGLRETKRFLMFAKLVFD